MTETVNPSTATVITVQGRHTVRHPAERARLQLSVNHDGSQREPVFAAATATAERMRDDLSAMHDASAGPVVSWSSGTVRVWGDRPWNNEGKKLPLVFHAVINFVATFNDFDALARFVESAAATDGVTIGNLEWTLTKARQTELDNDVRALAVADAIAKAHAYAKAVGLSNITPTAIADPGMLGEQSSAGSGGYELASASRGFMKMDAGGGAEFALSPEDIEVSAVIDARFMATAD